MMKRYYFLTKPGIIYGNSLSVIAGFFLASHGSFNPLLFVTTLLGIGFVMASGCVFNNYIDRGIDEKMERTKRRALVTKSIPVSHAMIFGTILGLSGFGLLYNFTNLLTTFIAGIGFFFYVVVYGIAKRKSVHGTIVGSISGAVPPVVGYVAVSNNLDLAALFLFLLLVVWQMPHFYAIALFRMKDYRDAGIPVLPIVKGIQQTKIQIIHYIITLIIITPLLTFFGYTGYPYAIVAVTLCVIWIGIGIQGFKTQDTVMWAKKMFRFSLIVLLVLCGMISVNAV